MYEYYIYILYIYIYRVCVSVYCSACTYTMHNTTANIDKIRLDYLD